MSLKGKLHCVGQTDTGRVREHNEDMIAVDGELGLAVLADGMGGYNAGEVASGIAVKTVVNLVREALQLQDLTVPDPGTGLSRATIILRDAIQRLDEAMKGSMMDYELASVADTPIMDIYHAKLS